jgi:hypothetical protein
MSQRTTNQTIEQAILAEARAIRRLLQPRSDQQMSGPEVLIQIQVKVLEALENVSSQIERLHQKLDHLKPSP